MYFFRRAFGKVLTLSSTALVFTHVWILEKIVGRPISLRYWQNFRRIVSALSNNQDNLFPSYKKLVRTGKDIPIKQLQSILGDDELGLWSLDMATIIRLWNLLLIDRPQFI